MKKTLILFSLLAVVELRRGKNHGRNTIQVGHYPDPDSERQGKFLSLFTIVNFQNDGCQSAGGGAGQVSRNGTCYTVSECQSKGGFGKGNCAAGFGVCCIFIVKKGDKTVSENCTYVQNPSFPGTDSETTAGQEYTVHRCGKDICTLRLDFEMFTIQGPGPTDEVDGGTCPDIFAVMTSTNQKIPQICGENMGQHIYVDIGSGSGNTAKLTFTLTGDNIPRKWDIKVTQIECTNPGRPPNSCLQYMIGLTGRIESFNFANAGEIHLPGQNYAVCIRPERGMCCVQYMVCPDQIAAVIPHPGFSLDSGNSTVTTAMVDDKCQTNDHVIIAQSADTCRLGGVLGAVASRYCGSNFNFNELGVNSAICDCTPPFSVGIFTNKISDKDSNENNDRLSHGVCLEYTQIPCG